MNMLHKKLKSLIGTSLILALGLLPCLARADVNIETSAHTSEEYHSVASPQIVFISDQVGYAFFTDDAAENDACYSKTTDGGTSWSSPCTTLGVDNGRKPVLWYDQWTDGDSGDLIHIGFIDWSADDMLYYYLDTSDDSFRSGGVVTVDATMGNFQESNGGVSITKATNGDLYFVAACETTAANCSEIYRSDDGGATWSIPGTNPTEGEADDSFLLFPIDNDDVMLIQQDVSADLIEYNIYDQSADSWSGWTTISTEAIDNDAGEVHETLSGTYDPVSKQIYIAWAHGPNAATGDIHTATWTTSGGWSMTTDLETNYTEVGPTALTYNSGTIYAAYIRGALQDGGSADIYYRVSRDNMSTWSSATDISAVTDDLRGVSSNMINDDRIYVYWRNEDLYDIIGDTIVDLIDISGTCDQQDQSSDCTDTGTIRVAINGTLQTQTQTTVAGTWTISGVAVSSGDVVTVFIDGAADANEAMAVTKYDGSGDMTGIALYENKLSIGSADNQTITNADIKQYEDTVDEDAFVDVDVANDLTVNNGTGHGSAELIILSGNTYRPDSTSSGNVATHDLEINGTFQADNNTVIITGSWDNNAAFTADGSQVSLTAGSGTETLDSTGATSAAFNNLTFNDSAGSATYQLESALDVNGNLTITNGTLDTKSGENNNITVAGNWSNSDTFTARAGTVTFDGTDQSISGTNTFYNFTKTETINDRTDVTLTFDNTATTTITNTMTITGLDFSDRIILQSDAAAQWELDPQGSRNVSYLEVHYSNNNNATDIDCLVVCEDLGNNDGWNFGPGQGNAPDFGMNF